MDLGCLDLGCIEVSDKLSNDSVLDSSDHGKDSGSSQKPTCGSKFGKSRSPKGDGQSTLNALNKLTSQIKKPSHRKNSPLNWFPRKKVDSYLKRKIKMLQEGDGMNLTLDETLGDSNPHYCRVLREKIAAREAAHDAMEARKAALIEASWCRILQAARIQSTDAKTKLLKAEETAAEAFEAAIAMGVIMYEMTNCPQKVCRIETSTAKSGKATHKVTASFETAFEVDKQVAAAVKTAFIKLASCPSFDKDEFKSLLHKISQNPDVGDSTQELSECESECGSEIEAQNQNDVPGFQHMDSELHNPKTREGKSKRRRSFEKLTAERLVDTMLERLRCLKEEELSSLATIVATCGLNAALSEVENSKDHHTGSAYQAHIRENNTERKAPKKQIESELPSLDKFLVKHVTKLEREVQEAKSCRRNEIGDRNHFIGADKANSLNANSDNSADSFETVPDLGSILVKHSSKLEKEIEEAKKNSGKFDYRKTASDMSSSEAIPELGSILMKHSSKLEKEIQEQRRNSEKTIHIDTKKQVLSRKRDVPEIPSLDKYLVKHVSRLEKDVQEAKNRSKKDGENKENVCINKKEEKTSDLNKKQCNTTVPLTNTEDSLDKILLVKPVHRLEREKMQVLPLQNRKKHRGIADTFCESLDKVLVKHVSRLEKEKLEFSRKEEAELIKSSKSSRNLNLQKNAEASLDEVLVKHTSRLERAKMDSLQQPEEQVSRVLVSRRQARERELQEVWGGLSLGTSIKPHVSKLERDKTAWIEAEEEERKRANET